MMDGGYIRLAEAAKQFNVSTDRLQKAIQGKKLPGERDGGLWKVKPEWVQEYLSKPGVQAPGVRFKLLPGNLDNLGTHFPEVNCEHEGNLLPVRSNAGPLLYCGICAKFRRAA